MRESRRGNDLLQELVGTTPIEMHSRIVVTHLVRVEFETEIVQAYEISPGLISIADDGRFGVKTVDADNRVRFFEADIVSSDPDTLWLTGLPETIRLITVGQGFVQPGDIVEVVPETGSNN